MGAVLGKFVLRPLFTGMARKRLANLDGVRNIKTLKGEVEIVRDEWGVPHIRASNERDMFIAQGYVHGQDRLFGMDIARRAAQGKLSQVLGPTVLDSDIMSRTYGFNRLGRADVHRLSEHAFMVLEAYAEGINAAIDEFGVNLPVEFKILGYAPERWSIKDTTCIGRLMSSQLSYGWFSKMLKCVLADGAGEEFMNEVENASSPDHPYTCTDGIEVGKELVNTIHDYLGGAERNITKINGSNTWALSPELTETGTAYLASDPHLEIRNPSAFYEVHLSALNSSGQYEYHCTGHSMAGMPGVMIGHNERIAWGVTLSFVDTEDCFIERINFDDNTYEYTSRKGVKKTKECGVYEEDIHVKGRKEPERVKVLTTKHGPVFHERAAKAGFKQAVSVQSQTLVPHLGALQFDGFLGINKARNWADFVEAIEKVRLSNLNISFADVQGNIGYYCTGRVPIRKSGKAPSTAVPGWTGEHEWIGEVPFKDMPHLLNPKKKFLVSCNNQLDPTNNHDLGDMFMPGTRAQRATELLQSKNKFNLDDMKAFQHDIFSVPGKELVATLTSYKSNDADIQQALQYLRKWDYMMSADSVAAAIYSVFRTMLWRGLVKEAAGDNYCHFLGMGCDPIVKPDNCFLTRESVTVVNMLRLGDSSACVKKAGGFQRVVTAAFHESFEYLRKHVGRDMASWTWGSIHGGTVQHPFGMQSKAMREVFNVGHPATPLGGDSHTLMMTECDPDGIGQRQDGHFNLMGGAVMRMVCDMGDLSHNCWTLQSCGQSGQLTSEHYGDQFINWMEQRYHPMLWDWQDCLDNAKHTITLRK